MKANVSTLIFVNYSCRPTGPAALKEKDFKPTDSTVNLHILDQSVQNRTLVDIIMKAAEDFQEETPRPVDIILVAIGGTGSGKGLTLMGSKGSDNIGVAPLLFNRRYGSGAEVQVLELVINPGKLAIGDLVLSKGKGRTKLNSFEPKEFKTALASAPDRFQKTSLDELSSTTNKHLIALAEHLYSSRSTILVTADTPLQSVLGPYRTTVIDPPGQESSRLETRNHVNKYTSVTIQGAGINQASGTLRKFLESVCRGDLQCRSNNIFSPIMSLHQSGNKVLLCVIAVLYAEQGGEASQLSLAAMKHRDIDLTGFIKVLGGIPRAIVNQYISKQHGQQPEVPVKLFNEMLGTLGEFPIGESLDDIKEHSTFVSAHLDFMRQMAAPKYRS